MNEAALVTVLKERLGKLTYDIIDEDLTPNDTSYLRYNSVNTVWVTSPPERIRTIDVNAVETVLPTTAYTINAAGGYITFSSARNDTDTIRADYSFFPFTDAQLLSIVQSATKQIKVLIFRPIDSTNIAEAYQEAILKKCYTIALREMQFPTIKYFSISIGGRSMSKEAQVTMIETLLASNEKELLQDINTLRYFDKTNVLS